MAGNVERRPAGNGAASSEHITDERRDNYTDTLRRRAVAAWRCPALQPGDGLHTRDPWITHPIHSGPCTFGLTRLELTTEARRLHALGWTVEEIRAVLDLPTRAVTS
ncbi:hypothetical protein [Pseudonocardia sp. 73-21]|uniref:hypothetical protein n=1 Tax=Pseudonocardia sp. 73-21 TaxID=1895809 RepID=UPI00095BFE82|nr:hypothetical protein [Pseudonocardia sp. 73-21]OJY53530.1 MAG: hypothetical protein BGP03_17500 [Pseudonocardia sp. 73-21]